MPDAAHPIIAAVVPGPDTSADELLRDFVSSLRGCGMRVCGLLQQACPDEAGCKFSLVDIETGQRYPISQNLGSQSTACMLDPAGLADATVVMRRIARETADLVVFNRFSGLEAEGDGFAAEMLDIMSRGTPVITIVQEKWLPAWRHFTGGLACELPADHAALADWFAHRDQRPV